MITVVLHLLRLLPFLVGGHRQLALENVALRHQLAVYKPSGPHRDYAERTASSGSRWSGCGPGGDGPS